MSWESHSDQSTDQGLDHSSGRDSGSQGSMFEEIAEPTGLEAYASPYEPIEEPSYDSLEDYGQTSSVPETPSFDEEAEHAVDAHIAAESSVEPSTEAESESATNAQHTVLSPEERPETAPSAPESPVSAESEPNSAATPITVLTADDFAALEDRILRAVSLVKREREARSLAEQRVAALESEKLHFQTQSLQLEAQCRGLESQLRELEAQTQVLERLEHEIDVLRVEREQVRQRVERLLTQLDSLEL